MLLVMAAAMEQPLPVRSRPPFLRMGPVPGARVLAHNEKRLLCQSVGWAVWAVWSLRVCGVTGWAQNPCPPCLLTFLQVLSPGRRQRRWQRVHAGPTPACDWSSSLGQSLFLTDPQFICGKMKHRRSNHLIIEPSCTKKDLGRFKNALACLNSCPLSAPWWPLVD